MNQNLILPKLLEMLHPSPNLKDLNFLKNNNSILQMSASSNLKLFHNLMKTKKLSLLPKAIVSWMIISGKKILPIPKQFSTQIMMQLRKQIDRLQSWNFQSVRISQKAISLKLQLLLSIKLGLESIFYKNSMMMQKGQQSFRNKKDSKSKSFHTKTTHCSSAKIKPRNVLPHRWWKRKSQKMPNSYRNNNSRKWEKEWKWFTGSQFPWSLIDYSRVTLDPFSNKVISISKTWLENRKDVRCLWYWIDCIIWEVDSKMISDKKSKKSHVLLFIENQLQNLSNSHKWNRAPIFIILKTT